MTLWEVDVHPAAGQPDLLARAVAERSGRSWAWRSFDVHAARGFLVQGDDFAGARSSESPARFSR